MIWKRTLLLFLLTITGLAFETSVFGRATLVGAKPELLLLIVVAVGMSEGPAFGATAGFVMGLSTDLVLQLPAGVSALTFTIIGYVVGRARAQVQSPGAWLPMAIGDVLGDRGVRRIQIFPALARLRPGVTPAQASAEATARARAAPDGRVLPS